MRTKFLRFTALLLLLVMALGACGPAGGTDTDSTEVSDEVMTRDPNVQDEIVRDIYIEREEKEVKNILMIGNSFCYYYVEELCGIASADGYELTVANLYKSGAKIVEHVNSLNNDTRVATLFVTTSKGRNKIAMLNTKETLEYAEKKLKGEWDVISLQNSGAFSLLGDVENTEKNTLPQAKELYDYIKENYPEASLYWHQPWAYEIGYGKDKSEAYQMNDVEHRTNMHKINKNVAQKVANENGVKIMPTGDAWEIARKSEIVGTTLCQRKGINGDEGDYYHDGDIGGGQYLNACVWYEVLMGKSCIGNTWRPKYELSEEKIAILQAAAHEAVAAMYGPGYAE